jgi:hypothetical protein
VGVSPTFSRPDQGTSPTFGPAPNASNYFQNFQSDPGYEFARSEALRGVNASYGARGLLGSDAAVKGIMQRSTDLANQTYDSWFNRQQTQYSDAANQYNADRSANFNIFNTNRGNTNANYNFDTNQSLGQFNTNANYLTNNYSNQANNLFKLSSLGTGAAGSIAGANSNFANNATNIYGNQGQNGANAAYQQGAAGSQLGGAIGGIANQALNLYNLTPNGSASGNIGTASQPSYAGGF